MKITEQLLKELHPTDFSALEKEGVLVLIYEEPGNDSKLLQLLHENEFEVKILTQKDTGKHIIEIYFPETEYGMGMVFNHTEETYPLRAIVNKGSINKISTGIKRDGKVLWQQYAKTIDLNSDGISNN